MNERIKQVRKALKLSQAAFGEKLGVSRDVINDAENGRVAPKEIFIKHLCTVCNVNEEWLRTGRGEMLIQNADSLIDQLSTEYHLDGIDRAIIDGYLQLGTLQRKVIKDYLSSVSAAFTSTNVQAFKMPAHGNSAAQGILSADDQSAMGKIKDDLSTQDDSDKI